MSKKQKSGRKPNLSPLALLRPRLDGLLQNAAWLWRSQDDHFADLDALVNGLSPEDFLPVLASAVGAAAADNREQVSATVFNWLNERDLLQTLAEVAGQGALPPSARGQVEEWLHIAGKDALLLAPAPSHDFFTAFFGQDEFGSQGLLIFLWYANRSHEKATGFQLLLDYNPPWEGSVKDVAILPRRDLTQLVDFVSERWTSQTELRRIDAVEAKRVAIQHLEQNRVQQIRLHRDLIALRDIFVQRVLALPDGPDTPPFSAADFDALCELTGQTAESIMHFERTVARRVRMDDGKEIFVDAALANRERDDAWP